jgi:phage tail tape-measure protein
MDPVTLASAAVAALSPYLAKAGESAAEKIGEVSVEAGAKLFGWLRAKLGGHGQEALDDLASKPESDDNQADLRKQLAKALEADPTLITELRALLPADATAGDAMVQNVTGAGAKAAQVKGSGNITNIN